MGLHTSKQAFIADAGHAPSDPILFAKAPGILSYNRLLSTNREKVSQHLSLKNGR